MKNKKKVILKRSEDRTMYRIQRITGGASVYTIRGTEHEVGDELTKEQCNDLQAQIEMVL